MAQKCRSSKKKNVKMYCMSVDQWNFTCIIFKHHMVILFFVAFYILSVCNVKLLSGALCFIMCIMFTLLPVVIPNQSFHHQAKRIQFAGNNFRAFKTVNLSCGLIMSILSEIIPFNENILIYIKWARISLLLVLRLIVNMQVLHSDVK